jgi:hypothetical protein
VHEAPLKVHQRGRSAQKRPDPPRGGKAVLGGVDTQNGGGSKGSFGANYDTHPWHASSDRTPSRGIPPLFKADAVNIAVSASKDGKLRVVYAGWDDARSSQEGLRPDPARRPQPDRQAQRYL